MLVNSFLGNDYRTYMQRVGVLASKKPAFTGWEPLTVLDTDKPPRPRRREAEPPAKGGERDPLDSVSDTSARNVVKLACARASR